VDKFEVGEVAIFCNPRSRHCGDEVTIAGPLHRCRVTFAESGGQIIAEVYEIEAPVSWGAAPTGRWVARPSSLRKRRPPPKREEVGEWDLCPWQPERRESTVKAGHD